MDKQLRGVQSKQRFGLASTKASDYKEIEKTLGTLRETTQTVLEAIEEGYVEVDLHGTTILCNNSFSRITGYSMKELIGMNYRMYVPDDSAGKAFLAYNKVFKTGIPNRGFYYEIERKDKERRIIENSISLIKDSEGHPIGFRSVVRDVTDRKRAERELEMQRSRLQAIFESVKDGIVILNNNTMEVVEANKAAESICGLSRKNGVCRKFSDCLAQCNKNCFSVIQELLKSPSTNTEHQISCNHHHRPQQTVLITGSRLQGLKDEFIGTVVVIKDVTRLRNLERELGERHQFQEIIGKSDKMQNIYELLSILVNLDTTVLITGASGTGKSLVAKTLHYNGNRALKPMVTVNCSALSENLLESELFGHVKGAFTGAIRNAVGRFQTASDGTILLDEIGDIPPRIQLKLLRVIEEREYERVGESVPMKTNARIIACTNQDLKKKVSLGEFREDLYYRLNVVEVKMPSLRERVEDIMLLAEHFMKTFNASFSKNIRGFSNGVINAFMNYPWPGNIRELRHSIEHAFVLCHDSVICLEHLPLEIREYCNNEQRISKRRPLEEKQEILKALERTYWNKAKAARLLGIDRSTLYRKIDRYGLPISGSAPVTINPGNG